MHETDNETGQNTTDGCADEAEGDGGVDDEESGVKGDDGTKRLRTVKPGSTLMYQLRPATGRRLMCIR